LPATYPGQSHQRFVEDVEYHLGNVYRKLGINRRIQLAPLFAADQTSTADPAETGETDAHRISGAGFPFRP